MKIIFRTYFFLIGLITYSQPILNSTDFNNYFNQGEVYNDISGSINQSIIILSGANQTWDFASLNTIYDGDFSFFSALTVPNASSFPNANYFINSTTIVGLYTDYYSYLKSNTKLEQLGSLFYNNQEQIYPNPKTIFQFPFAFTNSFTDTFQYAADSNIITTTVTYDGYGTLILPYGSFTNVARIKSEIINGALEYSWIQTNPYKELLKVRKNSSTSSFKFYLYKPSNLGVLSNEKPYNFEIYPNPFLSNFKINYGKGFDDKIKLNIYDLVGKKIADIDNVVVDASEIYLPNLPKGIYVVKILDKENNLLATKKLFKN